MTYSTLSYTLKYVPHREFDRIYTLYTRDCGKIEAVARGSQKILSKLRGHLEPGILTEVLIANGKRREVLCEACLASRQTSQSQVPTDNFIFAKLIFLQKFLHNFNQLVPLGDQDVDLFEFLGNFIRDQALSQTMAEIKKTYGDYSLRLLEKLGYR